MLVGDLVAEHGGQDVGAAAGEADEGGVVLLSSARLPSQMGQSERCRSAGFEVSLPESALRTMAADARSEVVQRAAGQRKRAEYDSVARLPVGLRDLVDSCPTWSLASNYRRPDAPP